MRTHRHLLLAVPLCLSLPACATVKYRLDPASVPLVERTRARMHVGQENVWIEVVLSSYGSGGGLIGGLVDAGVNTSRQKDAERRVQPLLRATEKLDTRARVFEKLVPALQSAEWPEIVDVRTSPAPALVAESDVATGSFLSLTTTYNLTPNASVLEIHTSYTFHVRGETAPTAVGDVHYWSKQIGRSADGEQWKEDESAIALWAANDGEAYRTAFDEGIVETARMLKLALAYMGARDVPTGPFVHVRYNMTQGRGDFGINAGKVELQGNVLERGADRVVLQSSYGPIYSLPVGELEEHRPH